MTTAKDVFLDALDLPPAERERFVHRACAGDATLEQRVQSLLAAHADADERVGQQPLVAPGSRLFEAATGLGAPEREVAGSGAQAAGVDERGSAERPHGDLALGDDVGPYRLLEELGTGGFGTVFLAEQSQPVRRRVALKVVKLGMDTRAVIARFEAERQALALMDHPHIARVFDAGSTEAGRPYFVMELVDGEPITRYCERRGLDLKARLVLFADLCIAIAHAHSKGVIHRDVKPNNVLVGEVDGLPVVKVIDFGIAKATAGALGEYGLLTREGHVIGTPATMAPEQLEGGSDVDVRADVYALGLLLYELLAGQPAVAVEGLELGELRRQVREVDPPRPSLVARGRPGEQRQLPADLDWIVMRCLEKDRARRYAGALQLAEDIENFLASRPVQAAPPSTLYRMTKLARRHRTLVLSVTVVLLALVVAVAGLGVGLQRAGAANARLQTALDSEAAEAERARLAEAAQRRSAEDARLAEQRARTAAELARAAEQLARVAADEARDQAEISTAVLGFLDQDLLGAAAPSAPGVPGRGRDVRVLEVLDVASRRLQQDGPLADRPRVAGALHHTLGTTYAGLGEGPRAAQHLRRARQLLEPLLGAEDGVVVDVRLQLVGLLREAGEVQAAAAELSTLRAQLDTDDEALLAQGRARVLAAWLAADEGRFEQAADLAATALAGLEAVFADEQPVVLEAVEALAVLRQRLNRDAEAEALFRRARAGYLAWRGPDDPESLVATLNLANFLRGHGQLGESQALYEQAVATLEDVAGGDHPDVVPARLGLGYLMMEQGRFDQAREQLERALEVADERLGDAHPETWDVLTALGQWHERTDDVQAAQPLYRRAYEAALAHRGHDHPATLAAAKGLTSALFADGRLDEAEPLMAQVLAGERRVYGEVHSSVLNSLANLAFLRAERGQLDAAASDLSRAREVASELHGADDHPQVLWLASNLVEVRLRQGRFDEAVALAGGTLLVAEQVGFDPVELAVLCRRLGDGHLGLEQFDEAERWLLAAHELLDPGYRGHFRHAEVRERLAALYQAWGRPGDAVRWAPRP